MTGKLFVGDLWNASGIVTALVAEPLKAQASPQHVTAMLQTKYC